MPLTRRRNIGREIAESLASIRGTKMAKRKHEHKRMWLAPNDPDSMAWVQYHMPNYSQEGEMDIEIADCFRHISLTLNNKKDQRKIEKLIVFLQHCVDRHAELRDAKD